MSTKDSSVDVSTTQSTNGANSIVDVPQHSDTVRGLCASLFQKQNERAVCQKRSKVLLEEMQKIKSRCTLWMQRTDTETFAISAYGRQLRRVERVVHQKVKRDEILNWIEEDYGISERRRYEQRIKQFEARVSDKRIEYRITYVGVRRKGERVAPDNGSVGSRSKRARPQQ